MIKRELNVFFILLLLAGVLLVVGSSMRVFSLTTFGEDNIIDTNPETQCDWRYTNVQSTLASCKTFMYLRYDYKFQNSSDARNILYSMIPQYVGQFKDITTRLGGSTVNKAVMFTPKTTLKYYESDALKFNDDGSFVELRPAVGEEVGPTLSYSGYNKGYIKSFSCNTIDSGCPPFSASCQNHYYSTCTYAGDSWDSLVTYGTRWGNNIYFQREFKGWGVAEVALYVNDTQITPIEKYAFKLISSRVPPVNNTPTCSEEQKQAVPTCDGEITWQDYPSCSYSCKEFKCESIPARPSNIFLQADFREYPECNWKTSVNWLIVGIVIILSSIVMLLVNNFLNRD